MINSIDKYPKHIGIIMDGNRKWAKKNNQSISDGYIRGQKVFDEICLYCNKIGIQNLTTFAFSLENWNRTNNEIRALLDILFARLQKKDWFIENNIQVSFSGKISLFSMQEQRILEDLHQSTINCDGLKLTIALNYDGYEEIVHALNELIKEGYAAEDITKSLIDRYLYISNLPELDMIIRTANVQRLTRFMLWKSSYAECIFIKKYWPDFTTKDLDLAIEEYERRERRYGK